MATPTNMYLFGYSVSVNNGVYTIQDSNPGSQGVDPIGIGLTVLDRGAPGDSASSGDSRFNVTNVAAGGLPTGRYDFVAGATLGGSEGYIVLHSGEYYFLTNTPYGGSLNNGGGQLQDIDTGVTMPLCFLAGTLIATSHGEMPIEQLSVGQMVKTADGRFAPVRWVGRQTVSRRFAREAKLPVRVRAGAFDDNVPSRDLLLSAQHALLVDGVLVNAGTLVNGTSIVREYDVPETFTYYTVELDEHCLILAENTPAESFVDNVDRDHFDNWDEHEALYPAGKVVAEMELPRAKAYRQVPKRVRERLEARAAALQVQAAA